MICGMICLAAINVLSSVRSRENHLAWSLKWYDIKRHMNIYKTLMKLHIKLFIIHEEKRKFPFGKNTAGFPAPTNKA